MNQEIVIQITGNFDVNQLVRNLGRGINFGCQHAVHNSDSTCVQPLLSESDLDRLLNGEEEDVEEVVNVRNAPLTENQLSDFLYGAPPRQLSQHQVDLAIRNQATMTEQMVDQHLSGQRVLVMNSVDEVTNFINNSIEPGDRVDLQDVFGNIIATYSH